MNFERDLKNMRTAGVNNMLMSSFFNVTVVTKSMPPRQMLNCITDEDRLNQHNIEMLYQSEEYRALVVLHTTDFADMSQEVRDSIPVFIKKLTDLDVITPKGVAEPKNFQQALINSFEFGSIATALKTIGNMFRFK